MVRDGLKLRSEEEFSKKIEEDLNRYIDKVKTRLFKGLSKSIREDKEGIADAYLKIIKARYSRGDEIEMLKEPMINLIEYLEGGLNYKSYSTYKYNDMLNYISLAYLLDIDRDNFEKLAKVRDRAKSRDNILDFIINAKLNDRKVNRRMMKWGRNQRLAKVINASSKEEAQEFMKNDYLRYWYTSVQSVYWHNTHKVNLDNYTGYWSFEAAAITKILDLDDSSYRDNKYYPKDMIKREENE
ncbi:MAG: Unknown protein [uncultured Sulfurovum sp.]|uniref:DUF1911 domain-containing protein n=1 Tax=uncultured Sulfurovum sp. TaxID=269237 RepID=A0A6S6S970_9BACT|nr:MAG: Unknown protein [uncultured Sulfurovum sp.]